MKHPVARYVSQSIGVVSVVERAFHVFDETLFLAPASCDQACFKSEHGYNRPDM